MSSKRVEMQNVQKAKLKIFQIQKFSLTGIITDRCCANHS